MLRALGDLRSVVDQLWSDSDLPLSLVSRARTDLACLELFVDGFVSGGLVDPRAPVPAAGCGPGHPARPAPV